VPEAGQEAEAAASYAAEVTAALREVMSNPGFQAAAARCAVGARSAGGVPRAVEVVLAAATARVAADGARGKVEQVEITEQVAPTKAHYAGA